MHAFPIRNDADRERAIALIDDLWSAEPGTVEHDTLHVMSELVDAYDARRSTLPAADPVELVAFKLRELGWSQRELGRRLGWGGGRVSEVLGRRRPLTLAMVRDLSRVLDLPAGLLVHERLAADEGGVWMHLPAAEVAPLAPTAHGLGLDVDQLVCGLLADLFAEAVAIEAAPSATVLVRATLARAA